MKRLLIAAQFLLLVFFLNGCTTQTATIKSEVDTGYTLHKGNSIYIVPPEDLTISAKRNYAVLSTSMKERGFNIVESQADSEFSLTMELLTISSNISTPTVRTSTTFHSGMVAGVPVHGRSTQSTTSSRQSTVISKNAVLSLFIPRNNGQQEEVWNGLIAMHGDVFDTYFKEGLDILLDAYGTNHETTQFVP